MRTSSRKGTNTGAPQRDEGKLPHGTLPTLVERGKKFAAYNKNGKLIILGYERRIVQEYANAQSKV